MRFGQPSTSHNHPSSYRPDIDGLRALAVIAVIINHFGGNRLTSGYLGVDIFFVISGYVISASLMRQPSGNLKDLLSGFYARRVKRILPALLLFVAIISPLICLVNPRPEDSINTGIAALFGASNGYLHQQAANYFAASTQLNALTHTWSLGVEEQFYLIYPIIFWLCLRNNPTKKPLAMTIIAGFALLLFLLISRMITGHLFDLFPGHFEGFIATATHAWPILLIPIVASIRASKKGIKNAFIFLAALSGFSMAGFLYFYPIKQASAYFLMPARFWELGAGSLLSLLILGSNFRIKQIERLREHMAIPAFAGLILTLFLPLEQARLATVLVVALTCILIYSLEPGNPVHSLLTNKYVIGIGIFSYSLYLWHWGVLAISRWTIGIHPWTIPIQIAIMLAAAWASYRYIEAPMRKATWAASRSGTIGIGIGLMVATAAFLGVLSRWGSALALDRLFPTSWSANYLQGAERFQQGLLHNTIDEQDMLKTLNTDAAGLELARPRLYVFGDSHSNHYLEAIKKSLPKLGVGSASVGWQCGYISPLDINSQTKKWMADCDKYSQFVDKFLTNNLRPGDTVLLGHRWKEKKSNQHSEKTLNHLAQLIQAKGGRLLLIDDVPEIDEVDPLLCNKRPWRPFPAPGCFRSEASVDADQQPFEVMAERIQKDNPNVTYVKLRDLYCINQVCGPYKGDLMIYRDSDHLTEAASELGAQRIAAAIEHSKTGQAFGKAQNPSPNR